MGLLSALFRMGRKAAPEVEEAVTRIPMSPVREIGAGGLPVRESEPFKRSFRGGTEDLLEAVRMGRLSWPEFLMLIGAGAGAQQNAPGRMTEGV